MTILTLLIFIGICALPAKFTAKNKFNKKSIICKFNLKQYILMFRPQVELLKVQHLNFL